MTRHLLLAALVAPIAWATGTSPIENSAAPNEDAMTTNGPRR